ncbi:P-loop containing nucleoside triphosphate hydrolase protein [Immersiella caudata]|uniref:ATP-dependent RNA helicase n=1 Tax=Immersiella caudata TaxID=314043 RepID=A0AA39XFM2_9PEZI|nr:P-loop containing nucleoside triphosphate hydrolase protein [Immersiella caudata]
MDIFKVLSRGIKSNPKKHTPGSALPSAGARPNPQFFHDEVAGAASRGKKRKRRKGAASGENNNEASRDDDDSDISDVDYFAPKGAAKKTKEPTPTEQAESPKEPRKPKLLDEEECRATLKSHRLKFTILGGGGEASAAPAKKKVKKGEEEKEKEKEKHKEQIFPQPLTAFGELRYVYGVAPQVSDNLVRQGFRVPTEVQMGSLPLLLRPGVAVKGVGEGGVDFLGVAPTGSGKTISFLIPAIDAVLRRRAEEGGAAEENMLQAVVVAPTRELASQIVNEGRKLAIGTGVRVVLMKRSLRLVAEDLAKKGDGEADGEAASEGEGEDGSQQSEEESEVEKEENEGDLKEPKGPARVDILVTTPKTLLNLLSGEKAVAKNPKAKKALPTVRSLILDEADVLLDPIFRKQTMAIWRACTRPDLALTCWSATMASNIEALITKELEKRARRLSIGHPYPVIRLVVGLKDTAVPNVTHKLIYTATEEGKLLAIRQLLHPVSEPGSGPPLRPPFLVFTQTIERAQALHDELKYDIPLEAGGSARVAVLHSSLADSVRSKIMARFRAGEVWVLITTDILARGVDFAGVNGVVNYDVPGSAAAYVHRVGRTGRAGREGGVAVTFYTKDDIPFVKSVANVIAASEKQASSGKASADTSNSTVQKWLLDALPKVAKEDKRKLKVRGVESRRAGGKASITTKSTWELRKERNKLGAIEASKRKKREAGKNWGGKGKDQDGSGEEWGGLDD